MKRRDFIVLAAALPLADRAIGQAAAGNGVALVLGGGGCRGYGHLGVLRALEAAGLRPDIVVGSSVGALVGGLYAAGLKVSQLERFGEKFSPNILRSWIIPKLGLFGGDGIARFVRKHAGQRNIQDLKTKFAAVATDLLTGEAVLIDRGELGIAVQASASAPGLLEPVRKDGRALVEGNLSLPVPVTAARQLGARAVIAVDVTFPPEQADLEDPYDALYQGFSILTRKLALEERAKAEVLVAPDIPKHTKMSKTAMKEFIDAGEHAAQAAMPKIRALFPPAVR
jgi:NTE family protein